MTHKKYPRTKRLLSELLTTEGSILVSRSAGVNIKEAPGQHSTQSAKTEIMPNTTMISGANTSSPTESEKKSERIAATLFRSTVLTLMKSGRVKKGTDNQGNTVIVLPSTFWSNEIKLLASEEK